MCKRRTNQKKKKNNLAPGRSNKSIDLEDSRASRGKTKKDIAGSRKITKITEEESEDDEDDRDFDDEVNVSSSDEDENLSSSEDDESMLDSMVVDMKAGPSCLSSNCCDENNEARNIAAIGQFVIVMYEGQKFPGKIVSLDDEGALVSTLRKCKHVGWTWPTFKDEIDYDWEDVLKCNIEAIPLNSRGTFKIPDLEEEWGK